MPASINHLLNNKGVLSVLAKWPEDQRYYKCTVDECKEETRRCLVRFEDGVSRWMEAEELHLQLLLLNVDDENIVCCVCDGGISDKPNEIIMCDFCQQGYHVQCHKPVIDRDTAKLDDDSSEWMCATCQDIKQSSQQTPKKTKISRALATPKTQVRKEKKIKAEKKPVSKSERKPERKRVEIELENEEVGRPKRQRSGDCAKVEDMDEKLIKAAVTLANQPPSIVGTEEFVDLLCSMDMDQNIPTTPEPTTTPQEPPRALVTKATRKTRAPSAAA